jgi:hypothetical protein
MTFEELSHYLRLGGATLAIILAASVLAIGVAVERWIALWNVGANSRALTDAVGRHLLRGDISAARGTVERSDSLLADVYRVGFERLERSRTVTPGGSRGGARTSPARAPDEEEPLIPAPSARPPSWACSARSRNQVELRELGSTSRPAARVDGGGDDRTPRPWWRRLQASWSPSRRWSSSLLPAAHQRLNVDAGRRSRSSGDAERPSGQCIPSSRETALHSLPAVTTAGASRVGARMAIGRVPGTAEDESDEAVFRSTSPRSPTSSWCC